MALTGLAIAAALGLAKSKLVDEPMAEKNKKLAAETQRLSPWTGLTADKGKEPDPFGTALQFGATGAQMGAGYQQSKLDEAMANRLNSGGSLIYGGKSMDQFDKSKAMPMTSSWGKAAPSKNMSPVERSWWNTLDQDPQANGWGYAGRWPSY